MRVLNLTLFIFNNLTQSVVKRASFDFFSSKAIVKYDKWS